MLYASVVVPDRILNICLRYQIWLFYNLSQLECCLTEANSSKQYFEYLPICTYTFWQCRRGREDTYTPLSLSLLICCFTLPTPQVRSWSPDRCLPGSASAGNSPGTAIWTMAVLTVEPNVCPGIQFFKNLFIREA